MAPQNSALKHENDGSTSERLQSRYSPNLPAKGVVSSYGGVDSHCGKSICSNAIIIQEHEIPIWVCGEPRFISGITSHTVCNDVIQALIDDELACGVADDDVAASRDLNDYVIIEKWRDVEQALTGETHILPIWIAWGSAKNEVKFKLKINKNKVGRHQAESHAMKPNQEKKTNKKNPKVNKLVKLMRRLINQGQTIQDRLSLTTGAAKQPSYLELDDISIEKGGHPLACSSYNSLRTLSDDELFLVIGHNSDDDRDSGVHVEYRQHVINRKLYHEQAKERQMLPKKLAEETPKRKFRTKKHYDQLKSHTMTKQTVGKANIHLPEVRKFSLQDYVNKRGSVDFDLLCHEMMSRKVEIDSLLDREAQVVGELDERCAKYKAQNKLYTTGDGLLVCVDKVQRKLDGYRRQIIEKELELFDIRSELCSGHQAMDELEDLLQQKIGATDFYKKSDQFQRNLIRETAEKTNINFHFFEYNDKNKSIIV